MAAGPAPAGSLPLGDGAPGRVWVLAIDAGTTSVRCRAIGRDGRAFATAAREVTQHFPRPGLVEHDPDEIWRSVRATLREVVAAAGSAPAAIGITNQRETVVAWDRATGRPLAPAIVWQDRRTASECERLAAGGHLPLVRERTGLVLDPYFSATKMAWLLAEVAAVREAAGAGTLALGTVDSWLLWHLTGGEVFATDPSNASRTLLFDIRSLAWDPELCDLFGVPAAALATVLPTSGRFGTTSDRCGVPAGIPVSGVAGDQQAALFGQCCTRPGMAKNTYGTGSFVLLDVGATCPPPVDGLLTTVAWTLAGTATEAEEGTGSGTAGPVTAYALEGSIFVTGAAVQWLRDGLGLIEEAAEIGPLAATVDGTDGVYVVPAFAGLGSPWWDPHARGAILGITRGTGRAQLARAVVESMAYQTRDVVEAMVAASGTPLADLRVDGGAAAMDLLLQLQADQLGVPVRRPADLETTALGAAFLAGLAEGVWSSLDELAATWTAAATALPSPDRTAPDALHARWREALARTRSAG